MPASVGLFPRFALMRRSIDAGVPAGSLVSWDGLHNSAAGYDCIGRRTRRGRPRRRALKAVTVYVAADLLAGHNRAIAKSRRPDARQAGTAAHSHGSLPVVR
jgi:hypothetical protein